ncbi:MAG: putative ABC transporter ATP-binding protein [Candidatus Moanabacter tarae]|uniref:Putative ABC transporter ATP-binding protein n=1 Tax=Candidatus Moanibacter tarae TaxID=2200854 RepID=A0A2Z4AIN5_9BACT|nr:MAG: putative ABC transporter ATP-binding protein [Candidatus Moanabacter tarae]|tara:strand:- start:22642 stop:24438 length:1797 start_codon:yes stop_codon:yes gene_type:complete
MKIILRIIGITLQNRAYLLAAYASMFGATAAYMFLPKYIGSAVDELAGILQAPGGLSSNLTPIALIIMALYIVRGLLSYLQMYFGDALAQFVAYKIRNEFYDHVQYLSFGCHDRLHTGNLMSRAIVDVESIRRFINMGLVRAPYYCGLFLIVAVVLIRLDWRLGLASIFFMPIVAFKTGKVRLKMRELWLSAQEKMGQLTTVLQENLTGVKVVKAFASEKHEEAQFETYNAKVASEMVEAEKLQASNNSFTLFSFQFSMGIILWFGGWRVINGHISLGELTQFIIYMQMLALPVRMVGWLVNAYARAVAAGERLFEILDSKTEVLEIENPVDLTRVTGHVHFEKVSFEYQPGTPTLREIEIDVPPGNVVALLGPPGSGKSTIVNLLSRFYEFKSGSIQIDGIDVREVTLESLRRNIGIVHQDVFLFTTSIRNNITYGCETATHEDAIAAAKVAQLHDFIENLPQGYDTIVGERGSTLSGGQRQRLSIARAVILDPPILVLDDSTSSVDAETEQLIREAMESVMEGRTTFVIAHRLSTIYRADIILVLKNGAIVERGKHKELLNANGFYKNIYDLQLRPQEEVMRDINVPVTLRKQINS